MSLINFKKDDQRSFTFEIDERKFWIMNTCGSKIKTHENG